MTERTEPRSVDRVAAAVAHPAFPGLTMSAKALVGVLSAYLGRQHAGQVFPSVGTLAGYLGSSTRTVQRALDELCSAGLLSMADKARQHRPAVYELAPMAEPFCRDVMLKGFTRGDTGVTPADARGDMGVTSADDRGDMDVTSGGCRGDAGVTPDDSRGDTGDTSAIARGDTGGAPGVTPVSPEVRTEVPPLPPQAAGEVTTPAIEIVQRGKPAAGFVAGVLELGARVDARKAAGSRLDPRVLRWRERRAEDFWRAGGTLEVAESLAEAALAAPRSMDASGIFWGDLGRGPVAWKLSVDHRREERKHEASLDAARKAARQAERAADLGQPIGLGPRPLRDINLDGLYGAPRSAKA